MDKTIEGRRSREGGTTLAAETDHTWDDVSVGRDGSETGSGPGHHRRGRARGPLGVSFIYRCAASASEECGSLPDRALRHIG